MTYLTNLMFTLSDIKFPVRLPNQWSELSETSIDHACLRKWLLDTSSLTERVQSHCQQFSLTVIGQRQMNPELEEIDRLNFNLPSDANPCAKQQWQIREVLLCGNDQPWVFARSVLPQALCERDLSDLGSRPLGQIIFNDNRFVRQPFELIEISKQDVFLKRLAIESEFSLWGRRSLFQFEHHHLMVAEVFLPQSPAYQTLETNGQR